MAFNGVLLLGMMLAPAVLAQQTAWGQCGGIGWSGPTTCINGWVCTFSNPWYSQCLLGATPPPPPPSPTTTTRATTMATSTKITSAAGSTITPGQFLPGAGKTFLNIGQNYLNEWNDFANNIRLPAGISVYGDIYDGALNPDSQNLLATYASSHSGFVEIGLSWKDDMINHGYSIYQGAQLCDDIANGKYDSSLQKLGSYLAQYPSVKYLMRIDYEVSGNLHANTDPNQFNAATFDTTAYPKAFAHVRSVVSTYVKNIEFMYHPVRGGAQLLYPGDSVVDFQGFSIFNNDVCLPVGNTQNCQGSRLDPNVLKDIQFASKPKWIAESAPQPPAANDPNSFIDYLSRVRDMVEQYDFKGWTYINSLWTAHGWDSSVWGDTRIEANPPVKSWFQQNILANQRYVFG